MIRFQMKFQPTCELIKQACYKNPFLYKWFVARDTDWQSFSVLRMCQNDELDVVFCYTALDYADE